MKAFAGSNPALSATLLVARGITKDFDKESFFISGGWVITRARVPTATDGLVSRAPGWRRSDGIPPSPPLLNTKDFDKKSLFIPTWVGENPR